jgi:hypothetical protein
MFDDCESEFGNKIGAKLRSPETLDASFEKRLMESVRKSGPLNVRPNYIHMVKDWATEQRSLYVSPIAGLAMAAGFAGIIALGTLKLATNRIETKAQRTAQIENTSPEYIRTASNNSAPVQMVQFVVSAPNASSVNLVGDFNDWNISATPLVRGSTGAPGVWTINVPLTPGRHEYAFLVDGEKWMTDPASPEAVEDDFGKPNSVVTVGGRSI